MIDANTITHGSELAYDICIIGGGAAGISMAKVFAETGLRIVVLESGSEAFEEETQQLYEFTSTGHPLRSQQGYISRNRYLGGSTNTWMGQCAPLAEIDFKARSWVKDSGWPFSKEALIPFYIEAAKLLKLPDYDVFEQSDWMKYLLDNTEDFLRAGHIKPTPFLLANKATNMRLTYLAELEKNQNIDIIKYANVTDILLDKTESQVSRITVSTLKQHQFYVRAKQTILACGGLENARILLHCDRQHPSGLANHHDVLGRYYMEHPKVMHGKLFPTSKTLRSPTLMWKKRITKKGHIRTYLRLSDEIQQKEGLLNHSIEVTYPHSVRDSLSYSEGFLRNLKLNKQLIHNLVKISPHFFTLLESFEKLMLNNAVKFEHMVLNNHMEQEPNPESRVTLGNETDQLGMRKLNQHLIVGAPEKESLIRTHALLDQYLRAQNLGYIKSDFKSPNENWDDVTDSSHHIGTTRMHTNPKFGYVDENCKVHGIKNLYVVGSSVFPTGGHVNPTLTIVALAVRLARHLSSLLSQAETKKNYELSHV